jgi:hypothetical protein
MELNSAGQALERGSVSVRLEIGISGAREENRGLERVNLEGEEGFLGARAVIEGAE